MLSTASAETIRENGKTINRLGVHGDNLYFDVSEAFTKNCEYGLIYADINSSFGKAAYSTLLMAKASGKNLSRFDYSQTTEGGMCTLIIVEVQN